MGWGRATKETQSHCNPVLLPYQHVPFLEARLFSIVETAQRARNGMPHAFELASAQEIIRWSAQNKNAWHEENGTSTLLSPDAYISYTRKLHSIHHNKYRPPSLRPT